jgi:hypothetical protein
VGADKEESAGESPLRARCGHPRAKGDFPKADAACALSDSRHAWGAACLPWGRRTEKRTLMRPPVDTALREPLSDGNNSLWQGHLKLST